MNMRRLPSWIISYGHHIARAGLFRDYVPLPMPSREEMVASVVPDTTLNHFLQDGRFHIDCWIRMEHLREDLLGFIAEMTDVLPSHRQTLAAFPRVNAMDYYYEVSRWLSPSQREGALSAGIRCGRRVSTRLTPGLAPGAVRRWV